MSNKKLMFMELHTIKIVEREEEEKLMMPTMRGWCSLEENNSLWAALGEIEESLE
jgi:hypothetical protein